MRKFCYTDCPYLHPTEAQQNKFYKAYHYRPFHNCSYYNKTVKHQGHHPNLIKIDKCDLYFQSTESVIVCLCGSTRFYDLFQKWNYILTLAGKIVLSIGCDTKSDEGLKLEDYQKKELDELHLRKIDLADEIFVINQGGYIGESTRNEIEYAEKLGKPIKYMEQIE